jgi:hypothetical protein
MLRVTKSEQGERTIIAIDGQLSGNFPCVRLSGRRRRWRASGAGSLSVGTGESG